METLIFDELKKYQDDKVIRFDVPGHKGTLRTKLSDLFGSQIYELDINSMPRMDYLNDPDGIIKKSQLNIAKLHNAYDSRFLINGTTSGIQAMLMGLLNEGDQILLPRGIHKSVTSALYFASAEAVFLNEDYNEKLNISLGIGLTQIKEGIKLYPNTRVVFLINPTYYGISQEFEEIVKYCKEKNKIVIVDEAHGGHYLFKKEFKTAMDVGADISCVSYHKTLGSLTQSSLLLYGNDKYTQDVDNILRMLNTTSPSYLLMSSIEIAADYLENNGNKIFEYIAKEIKKIKKKINDIAGIRVIDARSLNLKNEEYDYTKLLINVSELGYEGIEIYNMLIKKYNIQPELVENNLILFVLGVGDRLENLKKLYDALKNIDQKKSIKNEMIFIKSNIYKVNYKKLMNQKKEEINFKDSVNKKNINSLMIYPPGIDIIKPGEIITQKKIDYILKLKSKYKIQGIKNNKIMVIEE